MMRHLLKCRYIFCLQVAWFTEMLCIVIFLTPHLAIVIISWTFWRYWSLISSLWLFGLLLFSIILEWNFLWLLLPPNFGQLLKLLFLFIIILSRQLWLIFWEVFFVWFIHLITFTWFWKIIYFWFSFNLRIKFRRILLCKFWSFREFSF